MVIRCMKSYHVTFENEDPGAWPSNPSGFPSDPAGWPYDHSGIWMALRLL